MPSKTIVRTETIKKKPVLIIDKTGEVGMEIARIIYHEFLPVVVTDKKPPEDLSSHIVHISFGKHAPRIPENAFDHIFFISSDNRYVRRMIKSVLTYAKSINVNVSFITSIYQKKPRGFERLSQSPSINSYVLGDVFSDTDQHSPVSKILKGSRQKKKIILSGNGLDETYPVSVYAAARAIVNLTYSQKSSRSVVNVYSDYATSYLSLSRQILLIDPDIHVDFSKNRAKFSKPQWFYKDAWQVSLPPLQDQLQEVYSKIKKDNFEEEKIKRKIVLPSVTLYVVRIILPLLVCLIIPFLLILSSALLGKSLTEKSMTALESGEYINSRESAARGKTAFIVSQNLTEFFIPAASLVGRKKEVESFSKMLSVGREVDDVLIDIAYAVEGYTSSTAISNRHEAESQAVSSLYRLREALLRLSSIEKSGVIPKEYKEKVRSYSELGTSLVSLSDVLPEVLGYRNEKKYLILFQNNNELRPGGGFIGSYGILTLDKGNIKRLSIHDVYDADGQLSAHIEPPEVFKKYMGITNWFLRDSNFSPDFVENAARAAYFLKLETGEAVDGVIAIDTTFLENLLRATGPISVEEYNETVTADNFAEKTQSQIEDTFFPGSQTKRTFLTAVSDDLYKRLLSGKDISFEKLLAGLQESISQKHVMIALADQSSQLPFTVLNLSGTFWDPRDTKEEGIFDFLGIVEANLGLNKVNPYIERYINQQTEITQEGRVSTSLSILYKNTATNSTKFGGGYKNYLQILMPKNADITSISINGKKKVVLSEEQVAITLDQENATVKDDLIVERGEVGDKRSVGFLVEVPIGGEVTLDMTISQQTAYTSQSPQINYSLLLFKQPGRQGDPYTFTFAYPDSYKLLQKTSSLKGDSGEIASFFVLDRDTIFDVSLGKK